MEALFLCALINLYAHLKVLCTFCQQLYADANYSQVLICNSNSGFSISHRTKKRAIANSLILLAKHGW